jgi:hypothetical protein
LSSRWCGRGDGPRTVRRADEAVGALAFSPAGERLAAYCPASALVCVWILGTTWTQSLAQRLQGPAAMVSSPPRERPLARARPGPGDGSEASEAAACVAFV